MSETATRYLHPMDAALTDLGLSVSDLPFPPASWRILQEWGGNGYALQNNTGLRLIIDCSLKSDDRYWLHVSVSRAKNTPTHEDMVAVKASFIGDRYAYAVYPPRSEYVNIHTHCLHLWALVDGETGRVLPEFSADVLGVKSI